MLTESASVCADAHLATARLATLLHVLAGNDSVRSREALAAAVANRVSRALRQVDRHGGTAHTRVARGFIDCLDSIASTSVAPPAADDPSFPATHRIARRAVTGALRDPTRGAVRWHHLGESPSWARGLIPSAWIGDFLFYGAADAPAAQTGR